MGHKIKIRIWLIVAALAAIAVAIGVLWFLHYHAVSQRNGCLNNLRRINEPQICCMPLEKGMAEGDPMDAKEFLQYFQNGALPKCPAGGQYIISYIVGGPYPKCTVHGNLLQELYGDRSIRDVIKRTTETKKEYEERMAKQRVSSQAGFQTGISIQSEPDVIIAKAIAPYRVKPYSELVKMVDAEPNTIDVKWSCSKAYQVAIWAMWENESNGNICVVGMVNAKEDGPEDNTLIPHKRSFIKSPDNQFVGEQDKDQK
jgi:hypothetical protein